MLSEKRFNAWLSALRSGKYTKIKGTLMGTEEACFCALGVLAFPILGLKHHAGAAVRSGPDTKNPGNTILPRDLVSPALQDAIWQLNDNTDASFNRIADWLERHRADFVKPPRKRATA